MARDVGAGRLFAGDPRTNNFDVLRITAAVAVLVSHAYVLTGGREPRVLGGSSLGALGVLVFFAISGHLVTESWRRDPDLWRFGARRALRILPGLVAALLVTGLVLGPLVSTTSLGDYLRDRDTHAYLLGNLAMAQMSYDLPGVFRDVPFPNSMNGSLWSLRPELHAYLALAALGVCGVLAARRAATAAAAAAVAVMVLVPGPVASAFGEPAPLLAFVAGAVLLLWREEVPWRWPLAAAALAVAVVLPPGAATDAWVGLAVAYAVVLVGYRSPPVAHLLHGHDLSYGTYLYAFPVQQSVAALVPGIGVPAMIGLSLPLTLLCAAASWWWVERPALRRKQRLLDRRRTRAHPVAASA